MPARLTALNQAINSLKFKLECPKIFSPQVKFVVVLEALLNTFPHGIAIRIFSAPMTRTNQQLRAPGTQQNKIGLTRMLTRGFSDKNQKVEAVSLI